MTEAKEETQDEIMDRLGDAVDEILTIGARAQIAQPESFEKDLEISRKIIDEKFINYIRVVVLNLSARQSERQKEAENERQQS